MLRLLAVIFCNFVRELWPLIDVRIMLPHNFLRYSGLLLHAKHCSRAISRFSDNSSYHSSLVTVVMRFRFQILGVYYAAIDFFHDLMSTDFSVPYYTVISCLFVV